MLGLERKVVVITGGASGIGRTYVESFVEYGACVAVADIDQSAAESLAADLSGDGKEVMAGRVDVSRLDDVRAFFEKVWHYYSFTKLIIVSFSKASGERSISHSL